MAQRGKYTFYQHAPNTWPAFAVYFGYQDQVTNLLDMPTKYVWDSHTKMPNAKVEVRNQDELKITDDYDEWLETVWTKKVFAGLAQAREDMQTMFLWAAIHKDLRRFLTQQIVKSQADQAVTDNDFMRELFKRDGGKEWLDFNLKKFCSAATAVGAAHHKHVMFNATVTADGTNAKFVLSKMIMAVEQTCGQPPIQLPMDDGMRMPCQGIPALSSTKH
jgi:hypothetical protein